jgi:hypothetical protein
MLLGEAAVHIFLALLNISKKLRFAFVQSSRAQNNKSAEGANEQQRHAGFLKCDCKNS